ncbi:SDR family NAD(P)-dependent oxidoreductase [Candidatus Sumerlaeota bacterium]|nr:SDR family NAD(P)-dependent oxidoreductase [Candidatus Sumerlaeota bacterium]
MKVLVTGGAGFIGSHLCDRLLALGHEVHALDDLSLGRTENIAHNLGNPQFRFIRADLLDMQTLEALFASENYQAVFHLAANSDIQRSAQQPDLDLRLTFLTTCNVAECARRFGAREIIFTSSSTIYGAHAEALSEATGPLQPTSFYGAAKLASEAFLCAYASLYDMAAWILRLPNVVGERMTHGCIHDFVKRLEQDPQRLLILGDGSQRKPYLDVHDIIAAMLLAWTRSREKVNCFNIGSDETTSVAEIVPLVIEEMGLRDVSVEYTGEKRGWPGDVARFEYDSSKIRALGWKPQRSPEQAMRAAVRFLETQGK